MKAMQSENRLTTFLTFAMTLCLAAVATTMLLYQGSPVGGHGGMVNGPHLQAASGHDADANSRQRMLSAYSRLPLAFEENQGQTDAQVKYLARGGGYTLFLTPNEAVLSLAAGNKGGAAAVVRMQMVGAQAQPKVSAEQRLAGVSNYFIGRDPHGWHRDVPHYGRVHVGEVYPGIDVAYHGGERQLEFDFLVAPGADPAEIALKFSGANQLQTDRDGNLALTAGSHEVVLHKPVAYQQADGMRQAVEARFVIENDKVAFALGSYDQRRELVIDPTVSYSTYLGGSGEDDANGIAVDATGTYITGETASADFPTAGTPEQASLAGGMDAFVTKIAASGASLTYSTYIGGSVNDSGNAIAVDGSGNAYVTGGTDSADFPTTAGAFQTIFMGSNDAFVLKLNSTGSALTYSTLLGGTLSDVANGVAVDSSGNAIVAGTTLSSDFPLQSAVQTAAGNAFVTKVNTTGASLVFSTFLGGTGGDSAGAVTVDSSGNAYVTGATFDSSFHVTVGAFQSTCNSCGSGFPDAFVTVYNSAGAYVYSTFLGGNGADEGHGIAVDSTGAYVTGITKSTDFPTQSPAQPAFGGGLQDAFVSKLNPTGTTLLYSTYLGGSLIDTGTGIAVDSANSAYVTGQTSSTNFPTASPTQAANAGLDDAFVAQYSSSGALAFSTYLGGSQEENSLNGTSAIGAVAVDASGNIYVTGNTTSSSSFPTSNALQATYGGSTDAFVVKYAPTAGGTFTVSPSPSSATVTAGQTTSAITVTVTSVGGFTGDVTLSCSGLPAGTACNFATNPVTGGNGTSQLTISTTGGGQSSRADKRSTIIYGLLVISGLAFVGIGLRPSASTKKNLANVLILSAALSGMAFLYACGGGGGSGGGGGGSPSASISPTTLTFPSQAVGTSSVAQPVTLTNGGTAALSITAVAASGDFSQTNNCGSTLAASASCAIQVTFTPSVTGTLTGSVTVSDNAAGSPQTVTLSGTGASGGGVTPPGTYNITVIGTSGATVVSGSPVIALTVQ